MIAIEIMVSNQLLPSSYALQGIVTDHKFLLLGYPIT